MHALGRSNVLTQRRDVHVAENGRVERVAAFPRCRRRMSRPARVLHVDRVDGDRMHAQQVGISRMNHHGGITRGESTIASHVNLAATSLLGRSSENAHPSSDPLGQCRRGQARPQSGGGDDVVSTTMSDSRECVVLQQNQNLGSAGSGHRFERGSDAVRVTSHG